VDTTGAVGAYLDAAFDKLLEAARRCGRHLDDRPLGPTTNSAAGLVVHCAAVTEFWLGHVALGRPTDRDRDGEFAATAGLVELEHLVARARAQAAADLAALAEGHGRPSEIRQFVLAGGTDESVALHVLEELYQHLGHLELTVDALAAAGALDEPLYHLALADHWEQVAGPPDRDGAPAVYEISSLGRTLAEEGFIHCSFADQVPATAARFYAGRGDVVLLQIDPGAVRELLRVEALSGAGEPFPHLYGPLPVDAVLRAVPLDLGPDGVPQLPELA
jgi:uncharacterized protein (DUF952 family)